MIYDQTGTGWGSAAADVLECARRQFYDIWHGKSFDLDAPARPLVWLHFTERRSFDEYARSVDRADLSWAEGYYSAKTHRVAVFSRRGAASPPAAASGDLAGIHASSGTRVGAVAPSDDLPRLTHEAAHQLAFESGLFRRGVVYPLWLSEGLALGFEADDSGRVGTGSSHEARHARLVAAAADGMLVPLSRFLVLTHLPTEEPAAVEAIYDQAWGVFALLLAERPQALRHYLQALAEQGPGRRSEATRRAELERILGDLDALESAWQLFLLQGPAEVEDDSIARVCR